MILLLGSFFGNYVDLDKAYIQFYYYCERTSTWHIEMIYIQVNFFYKKDDFNQIAGNDIKIIYFFSDNVVTCDPSLVIQDELSWVMAYNLI